MNCFRHPSRSRLLRLVSRALILAFVVALLQPVSVQAARANGQDLACELPAPDLASVAATPDPYPVLWLVVLVEGEDVLAWLVVPDPELAGNYHRARWMDPPVGRFTGMDPFGGLSVRPETSHKYGYVAGNPLNDVDPTGEFAGSLTTQLTTVFSATTIRTMSMVGVIAAACVVNASLSAAGVHPAEGVAPCTRQQPDQEVTVYRGLGGWSPSEFKRIDPDGLSTFEVLHPNPRYKFVLPFRILFKPPKRAHITVGSVVFPPLPGATGTGAYTPGLGDPGIGLEHWSLRFTVSDDKLPRFLADLAREFKEAVPPAP